MQTENRDLKPEKMAMTVKDVSFSYGKNQILKGASLEIPKGKITTILGANGCGKSTLFSLMTKNLNPDKGRIFLGKKNISNLRLNEFALKAAIVHQYNTVADDMTVERLVSFGRTPHLGLMGIQGDEDEKYVEWAMEVTNITEYRNREISRLSGGQRQRVWIAMALAQDAKVLLLDEPTTYLDIRYQLQILRLIRRLNEEYGFTIIMVLHDVNQSLYYSDEIVALKAGKCIAQGSPQQILTGELIQKVYDVTLKVSDIDGKRFILPV